MDLEAALKDEVSRLENVEAVTATKADRAADPTIPPPPATKANQVEASLQALQNLPPELATPMLVAMLDIAVRRIATWLGAKGDKFALQPEEHEMLNRVWLPVVKFYLPQLGIHPLYAALGMTAGVYALKALPEGGLNAVLAGNGGAAASQAAPTPQQLVNKPAPPPDEVLRRAQEEARSRRTEREQKEAAVA